MQPQLQPETPITPLLGTHSGPSTAPASYNQNSLMTPRSPLPLGQTDNYTPIDLPSSDHPLAHHDASSDDE